MSDDNRIAQPTPYTDGLRLGLSTISPPPRREVTTQWNTRYWIVGTRGVGYWPNGGDLWSAKRYGTRIEAERALDLAALTPSGGKRDSCVLEIALTADERLRF